MKIKSWFLLLLLITLISCNKTVNVGKDEIGIVYSNWNGKNDSMIYEQGNYKIPFYKGFTAAKIIEKNENVTFEKKLRNLNIKLTVILGIKPIPQKNFELYETFGLDYSEKIVKPILVEELKEFYNFQGINNELLEELRNRLLKNDLIEDYLIITKLELKQ